MAAGEDLAKLTPQFETVLERLVGHLSALFNRDETQVASSLTVDECILGRVPIGSSSRQCSKPSGVCG